MRKISSKDIGLGIGAKVFGNYKPINLIHFVMGGKNPSAQKTVSKYSSVKTAGWKAVGKRMERLSE